MRGRVLLQAITLIMSFIICFWRTLADIFQIWMTNDNYSHGFIVPAISAFFIWRKRSEIQKLNVYQEPNALPVLLFLLGLHVFGELYSSYYTFQYIIPFIIGTVVLFCFGKYVAKSMLLPIGFLFFMVPVPSAVNEHIISLLKTSSMTIATELMRACGVSVFNTRDIIDLGFTRLQVVDACSGLGTIIVLMAIGVVYANTFQKNFWKKILCVFVTLPIGILANGIRIAIIGVNCTIWGPKAAKGIFHACAAWSTFLFSLGILFCFGGLLTRHPSHGNKNPALLSMDIVDIHDIELIRMLTTSSGKDKNANNMPAVIITTFLFVCVGLII